MASTYKPILGEESRSRSGRFGRRYRPEPGVALVVHREGRPLVVLADPTDRLTAGESWWENIKAVYRVDLTDHLLEFEGRLPCAGHATFLQVQLRVGCAVKDPIAAVTRGVDDAAGALRRVLMDAMAEVSLRYPAHQATAARQAIRAALVEREETVGFSPVFRLHDMAVELALDEATAEHLLSVADAERSADRTAMGIQQQQRLEAQRAEAERERDRLRHERDLARAAAEQERVRAEAKVRHVEAEAGAELEREKDRLEAERNRLRIEHEQVLVELERAKLDRQAMSDRLKAELERERKWEDAVLEARIERAKRQLELEPSRRQLELERAEAKQAGAVHVRAQMEPQAVIDAVSTVSVILSRELVRRATHLTDVGGEAEVAEAQPILIEVIPRANVAVIGRSRVEVAVPAPGEPRLVLFEIRGTNVGHGEVWVQARQQQVPLVTLVLRPRIARHPVRAATDLVVDEGEAAPTAARPRPLRLLRIIEQRHGDTVVYRYDLEAPDLQLLHAFVSRPIEGRRDRYVANLFRQIEDRWLSSRHDVEAFQEQLRAFGGQLLDELFPSELQRILWENRDELTNILVLSTEPFIPWELVHLKDPQSRHLPEETLFLAQMGLVRWQWGSWPPERLYLRPGRCRYVVPEYPDARYRLAETSSERLFLEKELGATAVVPHHREVLELLRTPGSFDLLHFAGHGLATGEDIEDAQVLLKGRMESGQYVLEPLRASVVAQNFRITQADGTRPIVVLNACQVGRLGYQLANIGGFATAFVGGGAGAFVSSLWSVGDRPASIFVQTLHEGLTDGASVAEAATRGRVAARVSGDASWLAYTVYAHPDARVQRASSD